MLSSILRTVIPNRQKLTHSHLSRCLSCLHCQWPFKMLVDGFKPKVQPATEMYLINAMSRSGIYIHVLGRGTPFELTDAKEIGFPEIGEFFQMIGPLLLSYVSIEYGPQKFIFSDLAIKSSDQKMDVLSILEFPHESKLLKPFQGAMSFFNFSFKSIRYCFLSLRR